MDLKSSKIIYWEDTTDEEIIEENIGINPKESSVKVISRNKSGKCSFEIEGLAPFGDEASRTAKLTQNPAMWTRFLAKVLLVKQYELVSRVCSFVFDFAKDHRQKTQ